MKIKEGVSQCGAGAVTGWATEGMPEIGPADFDGFLIGNAENAEAGTGCTVILCPDGRTAGVDVRGGGPATRETDVLRSENMIEKIHGVLLTGGSAFGLDAASGVMEWLRGRGAGYGTGFGNVPIVCGAALFDLVTGDGGVFPDREMGFLSCKNAEKAGYRDGGFGAGAGATVGKLFGPGRMMKSGIGFFGVRVGHVKCGAVIAVNALGDVIDPVRGIALAGLRSLDGKRLASTEAAMAAGISGKLDVFGGDSRENTTIGCILTNARLTKPQANKLASAAHNGLAKAIRPLHTSADGDTLFSLHGGEVYADPDALGVIAAETAARAAIRAVLSAEPAYGLPSAKSFFGEV